MPTSKTLAPLRASSARALTNTTSMAENSDRKPRKNVSSACLPCRKRRSKCSGVQPCTNCIASQIDCVFGIARDGRSKRTDLANLEKCFDRVVDIVKKGDESEMSQLQSQINDATSVEDIEKWLLRNPRLRESIISPNLQRQRAPCPVHNDNLRSDTHSNTEGTTSEAMELTPSEEVTSRRPELAANRAPMNATNKVTRQQGSRGSRHDTGSSPVAAGPSYAADDPQTETQGTVESLHEFSGEITLRHYKASQSWDPPLRAERDHCDMPFVLCPTPPAESEYINETDHEQRLWQALHYHGLDEFAKSANFNAIKANGYPSFIQEQQLQALRSPEWEVLPLAFDDGSLLCRVFLSFWRAARIMIREGSPADSILGHEHPQVELFFRPRRLTEDHTVSNWACLWASSFIQLDAPTRLMVLLLSYKYMQWIIEPSPESYAAMFEYQRPTIAQRILPHCAVVDLVHIPELRTALCFGTRDDLGYMTGYSVDWPNSLDSAVEIDATTGCVFMTKDFENHVTFPDRFTYTSKFLDTFPELGDSIRVVDP